MDTLKKNNINASTILLIVAVLFVISTSMDYFNQCYTICNDFKSSLTYGTFTVAIIYAFYSLFIKLIPINWENITLFIINVFIISLLHNVTCKIAQR